MNREAQANLSVRDRVYVISKTYSLILLYSAHLAAMPHLDIDKLYKKYLDGAVRTGDRYEFGLVMMEFLAHLGNAHTRYKDAWIDEYHGQPLGFYALPIEGKWMVKRSMIEGLEPGDVTVSIDGVDLEKFFREKRRYIPACGKRQKRLGLFYSPHLFPKEFSVELENGSEVLINRQTQKITEPEKATEARWLKQGKLAYIKIPSFAGGTQARFEEEAIRYVKEFSNAKALIVDVRGNTGGQTPERLIKALMSRPYRWWRQTSPINLSYFRTQYAKLERHEREVGKLNEKGKAYKDAYSDFQYTQLLILPEVTQLSNPLYTGQLAVLVDEECGSSCEDFVMMCKDSGSAVIVGTRTAGSTGQPYFWDFNEEIKVYIGAVRVYFPDDSPFEGIGIAPDVEVIPSSKDLKAGQDVVLEKACELIS